MANLTGRRSKASRTTSKTMALARWASHPELEGATLVAANLTAKEASELVALDKRSLAAADKEPGAKLLSQKEMLRYEELIGALAGDREIFSKKRKEREV